MLKEVIAHTLEEEVLSSEGDLASWPGWRFCVAGRAAGTTKKQLAVVVQLGTAIAAITCAARARRLGTSFQINFSSRAVHPLHLFCSRNLDMHR